MELEVLGVGNAFTSLYYNTSFLVRSDRLYLIDGPQGLLRLLRERGIDPALINDVIVTHVHGDHSSGLETLFLWKKYVENRRVTLYTSRAVHQAMRERFFPGFSETFTPDLMSVDESKFEDYVDFVEVHTSGATQAGKEVELEIRENWHPTPTIGIKLSTPLGSVAISGDTCYRPALLDALLDKGTLDRSRYEKLAGNWLWSADVIYHEVTRKEPNAHTLEKDLLALPEVIRKKIRLVHFDDDFSEGRLPLARERERVRFPSRGVPIILYNPS